jgi:hypothetical protein
VLKHYFNNDDLSTDFKLVNGSIVKEFKRSDLTSTSDPELFLLPRAKLGNLIAATKTVCETPKEGSRSGCITGLNASGKQFISCGKFNGSGSHNMCTEKGNCGSVIVDLDGNKPKLVGIHTYGEDAHGLNGFIPFSDKLLQELCLN